MRWAERRLLARCDLLILSSPGFLRAYFRPVQRISTPVALLENKLWVSGDPPPRPSAPRQRSAGAPFSLGWVGSLRCARSLAILAGVAETLGSRVEIVCHGAVHRHAVPEFDAVLRRYPNIRHAGPYRYPEALGAIYSGCDAVWAQDLWQAGANSDWLLPNRIYEASYFGCPSIALAGTETGRRIARDRLGFTVEAPTAEALAALIGTLDADRIRTASAGLLARPEHDFRLTTGELAAALAPVLSPKADAQDVAGAESVLSAG
jgi:succinoglycan biosynthesis protein ExoL